MGALDHARTDAALGEQRRVLVGDRGRDRDAGADRLHGGVAEHARVVAHLRVDRHRDAERVQPLGVPLVGGEVVGAGHRGVGGADHVLGAAGELVDQPGVDGAEGQPPGAGQLAQAVHVVQHPLDAQRRVDRGEGPARPAVHLRAPLGAQLGGPVGRPGVLPDDGAGDRQAGLGVPQHGGGPLVGDADRGQVGRLQAGGIQRLREHRPGGLPDLVPVLLHPVGPGVVLRELGVGLRQDRRVLVVDQRADAGGARVDDEDSSCWGHRCLQGLWPAHRSGGQSPSLPGLRMPAGSSAALSRRSTRWAEPSELRA